MPLDKIVSGVYRRAMMKSNAQPAPPLEQPKPSVTLSRYIGQRAIHIAIPVPDANPKVQERRAVEAKRQQDALGDRWILHKKGSVARLDKRSEQCTDVPEFLKRKGMRKVK